MLGQMSIYGGNGQVVFRLVRTDGVVDVTMTRFKEDAFGLSLDVLHSERYETDDLDLIIREQGEILEGLIQSL